MTLDLSLKELQYDQENIKLTLKFKISNQLTDNISFAYYIFKNNTRIVTEWYAPLKDNTVNISYDLLESATYKIRVFIKDEYGNKVDSVSNSIFVDLNNNKVIDSFYNNEKIFYLDTPVKYIFEPSKSNNPYLLVVFSGLHNGEYRNGSPVYNYIKTLKEQDPNKLYILDEYNGQFCYYLGHNGRHDYEKAVISLITKTANRLNLSAKNIIACGSSKGGTAALYYSLKYHFGVAICGAPQIFIADFLSNVALNSNSVKHAFLKMTGENVSKGEKYINNLLLNLVEENHTFPDMFLHVGKGDYHFEKHLIPFIEKLKVKGVNYNLDLQDYSNHGLTGTFYAPYLLNVLNSITKVSSIV